MLYRDEVDMRLPVAEETFNVVNSTPIYPEELKDHPDSLYVEGPRYNLLDSDQDLRSTNSMEVLVVCRMLVLKSICRVQARIR